MVWVEMVMGRNGHGPKWLWAEMTSGRQRHWNSSRVKKNQRTIGPENAHLKPDPAVLSHHEMTLTLNTHTPLLNS